MRPAPLSVGLLLAACRPAGPPAPAVIDNQGVGRGGSLREVDWMNRSYDTAEPGLTEAPRRWNGEALVELRLKR